MATKDRGRPLPKFGEWDVNNPASAEGFTLIFNKARDEKKTSGTAANAATPTPRRTDSSYKKDKIQQYSPKSKGKWFCCGLIQLQRVERVDRTPGMI